jgi:hypothetical protein
MKTLGFVVRHAGDFAAIVKYQDEIYVVGQGERFAGRYRALSVAADAVEAVEDPAIQAHPPPLRAPPETPVMITTAARNGPEISSLPDLINCQSAAPGEVSSKLGVEARNQPEIPPVRREIDPPGRIIPVAAAGQSNPQASLPVESATETGTYVFQTLGYVKTPDGDTRTIVADESDLYLVKQGEIFAGRYRAISVESTLVLAKKVSHRHVEESVLSAQAEPAAKDASKTMDGNWHFLLSDLTSLQSAPALGGMNAAGPGYDSLNFSLAGSGLESQFLMAGNPSLLY